MAKLQHSKSTIVGAIALFVWAGSALAQSEEVGRDIFHGEPNSALNNITAEIGALGVSLPAASFSCNTCHGEDGRGRAERGVVPSDLRQSVLKRDRLVVATGERGRAAYTQRSFFTALTDGIDPSGNILDETMPRFDLSEEQAKAIWEYLDKLDAPIDVGLSDEKLMIGVFQSQNESVAAKEAVTSILEAFRTRLNDTGGIYGRNLELVFFDETKDVEVFAVIVPNSSLSPPTDRVIIGTRIETTQSQNKFRLIPDKSSQLAALRMFAIQHLDQIRTLPEQCPNTDDELFLLATFECEGGLSRSQTALFTYSAFQDWAENPAADAPGRIYVALPYGVDQIDLDAQRAFAKLRSQIDPQSQYGIVQAEAYSTLVVALEALVGAGRSLTQSRFIERLGLISEFEGALMPPISYSENRRVGSVGSLIVPFDASTGRFQFEHGVWIDPAETS